MAKKRSFVFTVEVYAGTNGEMYLRTTDADSSVFFPTVTRFGWKPGDRAVVSVNLANCLKSKKKSRRSKAVR